MEPLCVVCMLPDIRRLQACTHNPSDLLRIRAERRGTPRPPPALCHRMHLTASKALTPPGGPRRRLGSCLWRAGRLHAGGGEVRSWAAGGRVDRQWHVDHYAHPNLYPNAGSPSQAKRAMQHSLGFKHRTLAAHRIARYTAEAALHLLLGACRSRPPQLLLLKGGGALPSRPLAGLQETGRGSITS